MMQDPCLLINAAVELITHAVFSHVLFLCFREPLKPDVRELSADL